MLLQRQTMAVFWRAQDMFCPTRHKTMKCVSACVKGQVDLGQGTIVVSLLSTSCQVSHDTEGLINNAACKATAVQVKAHS